MWTLVKTPLLSDVEKSEAEAVGWLTLESIE